MNRRRQTEKDSKEILTGTRLDVYQFILTSNKPVGTRETARGLGLSSPSIAQHHLVRLDEMGLIKRKLGGYVVSKIVLQNHVKLNRFLIPRNLFYLTFAISTLTIELCFYPDLLFQAYIIILIQTIMIAFFAYETIKIRRKKTI
jgi:hypothetical protein